LIAGSVPFTLAVLGCAAQAAFIDTEESNATLSAFFSRETGLPLVALVAFLF
jgi:hypothetical protein